MCPSWLRSDVGSRSGGSRLELGCSKHSAGIVIMESLSWNHCHGIVVMESLSWNHYHGIVPERAGLGRTLKPISFHGQAHIPLSQGAPNPIQLGKQAKKLSRVHFKEEAKIQRSCSLFFPRFPSSFVSDLCPFSSHPRKHLAMLQSPMDPLTSPSRAALCGVPAAWRTWNPPGIFWIASSSPEPWRCWALPGNLTPGRFLCRSSSIPVRSSGVLLVIPCSMIPLFSGI